MALACSGLLSPSGLYRKRIMSKNHYRDLLSCKHVNPIFLWLVGSQGEGLPKKRSPKKETAAAADDSDDDDDDGVEELLDISEEAALLAEQRELGNDPTFLMNREESRIKIETDFDFVPRKRINGESRKERINRHKMEKAIEQCINSTDPMSEEEVSEIRNIWELSHFNRWRLYCYWAVRYIRIQQDIMLRYQVAYERLTEERREIDREEDYQILREAKVIGFTTTGAAKHRALLQRVRPRIIVVEEAAEVLEAHIITTLTQDCQHLILIGDHQQLRPKPTVYRLEKEFHLDVSLFERMINNGLPCHRLGQQHRMRPEISILMKEHFYDGLEDHSSVNNYPSVKGVTKNLFFVEHDQKELNIADNRSKSNVHEAKFLVEFCYYLLQQGYSPSQITILTTYTGQLFNFKRLMSKEKFEDQSGNRVRVSVVDNFQGEENDIILLSLVRSNDEGSIGFLNIHNRVCVALSRAKIGLFCIGNTRLLANRSPLWKKIKNTATEAKQIGPKIPLVCQNHPETLTEISSPDDFLRHAPDGGCSLRCEARLDCGHACRLHCHPKDPNHEEYKCMTDCKTVCDRGHNCTLRCYQECQCQVQIRKLFAKCQHTGMVKCHEDETAICQKPCTKKMPCNRHDCPAVCGEECPVMCRKPCPKKIDKCGHHCPLYCGKPCITHVQCKVKVEVKQPKCSHTYFVDCKDDPKWTSLGQHQPCGRRCERALKCGHVCINMCFEKCQTVCEAQVVKSWPTCDHRRKMVCKDADGAVCQWWCARKLPCGHSCPKKCKEPCLTQCKLKVTKTWPNCKHQATMACCDATDALCRKPCTRKLPCGHKCSKSCGEACDPLQCKQNCGRRLSCGHPCKKKCNESCDVTSCKYPCKKRLPCRHRCHKLCNEPCEPAKCKEMVIKTWSNCNHKIEMTCSDAANAVCSKPCGKMLPCKHRCLQLCSDECNSTQCKLPCARLLSCGHSCRKKCNEPCHVNVCKLPCKRLLSCGHQCQSSCNQPCDVTSCTFPCKRLLLCGHQCQKSCNEPCDITPCTLPCKRMLPCGHQCQKSCNEPCDITPCTLPCKRMLTCGHQCQKSCNEPCDPTAFVEPCKKPFSCILQTFQTPSATWPICKANVHKTAACGHQIECLCCDDPESIPCQSGCTKKLPCGHPCPGTCSTRCDALKCTVTVSKQIPGCAHTIRIECHEDPASVICQKRCARKLACGHPCSKLCSETCSTAGDLCRKMVVRSLPECGHQKRLQCHEDPSKVQCDKVCKKKLPCGHECRKTCHLSWEACETKCKVRLHKKITQCGHSVKLPCHLDPDSGSYCEKRCQQKLECGHECKEKCGRPCTTMCKETKGVQKMLPCSHVAREIECYKDPKGVSCREQCTNRLPCGHDCKNVCGECNHRVGLTEGIASICKEVCRKRLLCGHQCRSKCRDCCGGQLHQPCRTRVDDITILCGCKVRQEECSKLLYLRHGVGHVEYCPLLHGLRLLGQADINTNICKHKPQGGYCDEPCTKLLKCKHTCIGLCGDPCIELCRFCNRREILKIFQEFQAETDPCYIQLQECGHIFEVNELKRKLGNVSQNEGSAPIHPIACPKCGESIREGRFNEHSGTVSDSVQEVVRMLDQQGSTGTREAKRLLAGSKYLRTIREIKKTEYGGGRQRRGQRGQPRTVTVRQEVRRTGEAHMAWKLKLLNKLDNILPSGGKMYRSIYTKEVGSRCEDMIRECVNGMKKLLESILDDKIFLTEQLAEDIGCELERVKWCEGLETLARNSMEPGNCRSIASLAKAVDIVTSPRLFTDQRRQEATQVLDENMHSFLQIFIQEDHTELQKADILEMQRNELGFLAGDWFKCSKYPSHVFQSRKSSASAESAPSCTTCEQDILLFPLRNVMKQFIDVV